MRAREWSIVGCLCALCTVAAGPVLGGIRSGEDYQNEGTVTPRILETDQRDHALLARVEQRLRLHDEIDWKRLSVEVKDGKVRLEGVVETMRERGLATTLTSTLPGVEQVDNRVVVQGRGVPMGAQGFENPPAHERHEPLDRRQETHHTP